MRRKFSDGDFEKALACAKQVQRILSDADHQ
jgi:hypothetical protein